MKKDTVIRINQIKMSLTDNEDKLRAKVSALLRINQTAIRDIEIVKRSTDARHKPDIRYVYSVNVTVDSEKSVNKKVFNNNIFIAERSVYRVPEKGKEKPAHRPVIVGMGPAGLFCAYYLAREGYMPIVLERGEAVDERKRTVEKFFDGERLNTESNVQFGEGGAGTFSDGKLNTMVKDKDGRNREVLETFVRFGAKKEILYVNKPHIGTDILCGIVKNMRNEIIALGGEVRFNTRLTDIAVENGRVTEIEVNGGERIPCGVLVLALGHSARDTFDMLCRRSLHMEPKAFAVGVRVEHPQSMINKCMYGVESHELLEAADYKVTYNSQAGRGVYSFCMCPGGYVVNASSENNRLAVNGMSYSRRDGKNANSAIIVTVKPEDYDDGSPLGGMHFQRVLEENAYREGGGSVPVQQFGDFERNVKSEELGAVEPMIKGKYALANLRNVFPDYISDGIIEGMHGFAGQIPDFDRYDAVLSGVESRTSSPVRILRDGEYMSNIRGIYPCGEGAGYAGGITSAAMDGIRIFEAVSSKYSTLREE